jgi:hypothetical protein
MLTCSKPFPILALLTCWSVAAAAPRKTENVILITLDGARTQEVFGGLDLEVLKAVTKNGPVEESALYGRYWAPSPEERRRKLLPFLWGTLLVEHGSIAGNRALGSTVELANRHRFSYPGYAEILTGVARDDVIKSNDQVQSPYPTVLEVLKRQLGLAKPQVATFASWETFRWIVEHEPGAIVSNAGFQAYEHPDPAVRRLSELQFETPTPWDSVRHDIYTFRFALAHLETHRPRLLYLALGETDDWAHDGRYDRTLEALERTDRYLRELWEFLEAHEQYRGRTSLLITTDHGRGDTPAEWTDHGARVEGAQYIWIAVVSPDCALRGEWRDSGTLRADQVAATLAAFLGIDYAAENPAAGKPLAPVAGALSQE